MRKKYASLYLSDILVILVLLALAAFMIWRFHQRAKEAEEQEKAAPTGIVEGYAKIDDGDSLKIKGQRIRLLGIDAPELHQYCRKGDKTYACGEMAKDYLYELINRRAVRCHWIKRDKYQRILGRCFVDDLDLNRQMVAAGWAIDYSSFSDGDNNYKKEERLARQEKRGIWQWQFERPQNWRKQHPRL